jgi:Acyl-CoA dehydrogenase, N-terminal domain
VDFTENPEPWEFYAAMAAGGWMGIAIPAGYGGGGGASPKASTVLEEVAASGACMKGASTEPDAGLDTTGIRTRAVRDSAGYRVTGRKVWTSKALECERVLLLTGTDRRRGAGHRPGRAAPRGRLRPGTSRVRGPPAQDRPHPQEMTLNYLAKHVLDLTGRIRRAGHDSAAQAPWTDRCPTGSLTTPRPERRGFRPSPVGVPVSPPAAPGRTRSV